MKERELHMSSGMGKNQRSPCLRVSATLLFVPRTMSIPGTGLPAYPTHMEVGRLSQRQLLRMLSGKEKHHRLSVCLSVWGSRDACVEVGEVHRLFFVC